MTEQKKRGRKPVVSDAKIASFIQTYTEKHGYSPNIREIGDAIGLKTTSAVSYRLHRMEKDGILSHVDKVARSWRVVQPTAKRPAKPVLKAMPKWIDASTPVAV